MIRESCSARGGKLSNTLMRNSHDLAGVAVRHPCIDEYANSTSQRQRRPPVRVLGFAPQSLRFRHRVPETIRRNHLHLEVNLRLGHPESEPVGLGLLAELVDDCPAPHAAYV